MGYLIQPYGSKCFWLVMTSQLTSIKHNHLKIQNKKRLLREKQTPEASEVVIF